MAIKLTTLWPPSVNGGRKIPVLEMGGIAFIGRRTIMQSSVWHSGDGSFSECWLWSIPHDPDEEIELLSIVKMYNDGELEIKRNDEEVQGVKFYDKDGNFIEFAPLAEDGSCLKCDECYRHITIDPVKNDKEVQFVEVS